jgi:NADH dehydrogenase/NADH:ubiquinone oxidoreductase subunit G
LLRRYAEEYGVGKIRNSGHTRKNFQRVIQHPSVIYEPGKCIRCGKCVRITEREGERLGLAYIGRGYDVRIGVPFNEQLSAGLEKTAEKCVLACPTGALSFTYEQHSPLQCLRDGS